MHICINTAIFVWQNKYYDCEYTVKLLKHVTENIIGLCMNEQSK